MTKNKIPEVTAMAFLNNARDYFYAAECVFIESQSRSKAGNRRTLNDPVYFLYFHTIELGLKAFLRSQNVPVANTRRANHGLTQLYEECRRLGLRIGADDRTQIGNIVSLLEAGNKYQGFRYFNAESVTVPDILWTREVATQLLTALETRVGPTSDIKPGPAVKLIMTLGKPVDSQ
jgi:hypothetical protein